MVAGDKNTVLVLAGRAIAVISIEKDALDGPADHYDLLPRAVSYGPARYILADRDFPPALQECR